MELRRDRNIENSVSNRDIGTCIKEYRCTIHN